MIELNEKQQIAFWDKVVPTGFCWYWTGSPKSRYGYVHQKHNGKTKSYLVHRVSYFLLVGEVHPQYDHLCRNTKCVNPDHLEPVTQKVNNARSFSPIGINAQKKQCKRGHLFDESNTAIRNDGSRKCRQCDRENKRRLRSKK